MQTRCPACHTLYRIDEDVLRRAGGQARCFRCDTVFDAYRHPAEDPGPEQPPVADLAGDSEALSELSTLKELPEVPDHSGVDAESELDLDDLAESLRHFEPDPAAQPEPTLGATADDARPAATGQTSTDDAPLDLTRDLGDDTPARSGIPLGTVLAGVLALAALAQLAWFNRDQVLATPLGHTLGQLVCGIADCELPPRRAPSRYLVLDRNIGADPQQQGALLLQLSFRNGADFPQPLPDIQLSLYDSEQQLMARRRLHPDEYLFPAPSTATRVGPDEVVQVDLRLEDPGRHATGFKLEFL